jgi:predicted MFS family arabinose efflux permease
LIGTVLHEQVEHRQHRLDLLGAASLTAGVALLLLAASEGSTLGWLSPIILGAAVGGVLLLGLFVRAERRAAEPLISVALLRRPIVAAGLAVGTLAGVVMFGLTAYVPPLVQGVMGGSPLEAGLAVGAMSIGWPIGSIVSGRAILRWGVRPIVLLGSAFLVAGTALLTQAGSMQSLAYTSVATAVTGLGMGFTTTPLLVAIQGAVSWQQRGQATGLVQFSRTIGGAVGTGLLGALLAEAVGSAASAILDPIARASIPAAQLAAERSGLNTGLGWIYLILVAAAAGTLLLSFRMMPAMHIGEDAEEVAPATEQRVGRAAVPRAPTEP